MYPNYMLNIMKKFSLKVVFFISVTLFCTACATTHSTQSITKNINTAETLYVYKDGRMQFKTRFVNKDDVVMKLKTK